MTDTPPVTQPFDVGVLSVRLTDDQAILGYDYAIEVKVFSLGAQIVPDAGSALITVKTDDTVVADQLAQEYDVFPGPVTKIVDSAAMGIGADGTLTYTLVAVMLPALGEDYVMEIVYTVNGGAVQKAVFLFDIVLNALRCSVTDDDLKVYSPLLANELWAGTDNYSAQIAEAFVRVKRAIKDKGKRPCMLIDGSQVRELVILKTFAMLCSDFAKATTDIWWARAAKYHEQYETLFSGLNIKYDEDQSGTIELDEHEVLGQVYLQR